MPNKNMFIRKKKIKGNNYFYIVKGEYESNGKLKQKVVKYLGTIENIIKKFDFWDKNN